MVIAEIKSMYSDKDQTWKTGTHNKEHKITKMIHSKQQKQMTNSDSTKTLEHRPGALVDEVSSAFLETHAELSIKSHVRGRRKRNGKL